MDIPNLNTLLQGPCRMPHYTDLRLVFEAIDGRQREFNWLVTDSDGWYPGPYAERGPHWLSGDELTRLVEEVDWQFVWGVFSGFPPTVSLDLSHLEVEPYADGNPEFWVAHARIQHPQAEVEIVCWDSSLTLLLCEPQHRSLAESFRQFFPEAVDLDVSNQRSIARRRTLTGE